MDYSSLSTLLTCPRKFQYQNLEKLASEDQRVAANFGSLWHKIQELHGQGHPAPVEAAAAVLGWTDPIEDYRTLHKASLAFNQWKRQWGETGGWKVLHTEEPFGVFPEQYKDAMDGEPLEGLRDVIVEMDVNQLASVDTGYGVEQWVVDFKTTSRLTSDWVALYRVSNQFKFYFVGTRETHPEVAGVIVDLYHVLKGAKKTGKTDNEREGNHFYRQIFRFDERALEEAMTDFVVGVKTAEFYKQLDYYPKNTSACSQFGSTCPFVDLCDTADPVLRNRLKGNFVEYTFSPWGDRGGNGKAS